MRLFTRRDEPRAEEQPGTETAAGSDMEAVLDLARARIEAVVDAAKAAAADIRRVADEQVEAADIEHRINRERVAADLLASLVERADGLRGDAEGLARLLDRASTRLGDLPGKTEAAVESPAPAAAGGREQVDERRPAPFQARGGSRPRTSRPSDPTGIRLLATQMAVAGSSRSEVAARLEREFGVADAGAVLDEVFAGTETG